MKKLSETIGIKLKSIRVLRELSQEQMADLLGFSVSGYAKIERCESHLTLLKLEHIATCLGITLFELLFWGTQTQTEWN